MMFATSMGTARRNDLSDFHDIRSNGKIAMKLDEGESLVAVRSCSDDQHVIIATRSGKAIRFAVDAIRVFKSRNSTGVRAIRLAGGDEVVSMSVIGNGSNAEPAERMAYIKFAAARRRAEGIESDDDATADSDEEPTVEIDLDNDRIAELEEAEQVLLTITENGYGKRTTAFEYRKTNRGGKGITNIITSERNGKVVASMMVEAGDQIMLMTDQAKIIRTSIKDIRVAGRNTQGVTIFKTAGGEKVVSAVRIKGEMLEGDDIADAELESGAEESGNDDAEVATEKSRSPEADSDISDKGDE